MFRPTPWGEAESTSAPDLSRTSTAMPAWLASVNAGERSAAAPRVALLVADLHRARYGVAEVDPLAAGERRDVLVGEHQGGRGQQAKSHERDQSDQERHSSRDRGELPCSGGRMR